MDQISPPAQAVRQNIDPRGIEDLADSIKDVGLVQPIILRKVGDRYEIIAGHRRYLAHELLHRFTIKAILEDADNTRTNYLRIHENLCREEVNPVDEAIFMAQMMEDLKLTSADLSQIIKRPREYVTRRLALLDYPDDVKTAVQVYDLSLNVARYLSQITDTRTRKMYLEYAYSHGITARTARYWLEQFLTSGAPNQIITPPEFPDAKDSYDRPVTVECELCGSYGTIEETALIYVHHTCRKKIFDVIHNSEEPAPVPLPNVCNQQTLTLDPTNE
jgi:ParB family chromosome partitioning protein